MKPFFLLCISISILISSFGQDSTAKGLNLCEPTTQTDKLSSFLNIPQYFDYAQARKCQVVTKKKLLIYFTGRYCVTCRKMEENILSNADAVELLKRFIIVTLYVDDEKVGKENATLQEKKYNSVSQPQFIIEPIEGTWKSLQGYLSKMEFQEFIQFLKQ